MSDLVVEPYPGNDPARGTVAEVWRTRGWELRLYVSANTAGEWFYQIYVPSHPDGPWRGPETEYAVDHPEAAASIERLCASFGITPKERSLGDFRFHGRDDWQRVVDALRAELTRAT